MLALYVAHLPWSWSHKLLHRSTDNAVPVHPCHVAKTGRAANMESVCKCAWSSWQEAADLHMEYLNRIAKDAIKGMGTNKTEKAVMRVGRAIGTITPLLANFDEENCIATPSSVHHAPGSEKDVISELRKAKLFTLTTGRKHPSFPHPKSVLHSKKIEEVIAWTTK